MKEIAFKISAEEVQELSSAKLNEVQIRKILEIVENDPVLWDNIETSIESAIRQISTGR